MNRSRAFGLVSNSLALAALTACANVEIPDYYTPGSEPVIDALDPVLEPGNMGGVTVTITGSRLGSSADDIVVTIGGHNANILSATDGALVVESPPGPLSGGPVDVVVATADGYAWKEDAYTYDVAFGADVSPYTDQTAYLSVQNLWTSCLGGMWAQTGTDLQGQGCETVAYIGATGLSGAGEFWKSPWPRGHADQVGWVGNTDFSPSWRVQRSYQTNFLSGYDDLRFRVGELWLENPVWEGERLCVNPSEDPADNGTTCSDDQAVAYDLDKLRFCETYDADSGGTRRYLADWSAKKNFFASDSDDDSNFEATPITLHIDGEDKTGLDGAEFTVPGSIQIRAVKGFGDTPEDQAVWAAAGSPDACLDADGDGSATLDEAGIVFEWDPIPEDVDFVSGKVEAAQSYVMVSVTWLPLDWFGLSTGGPRASIVVPDDVGRVEIPNSVMYQFPSPNFDYAALNEVTGQGHLGTFDSRAAYLLIEVYRYTDLRVVGDRTPDDNGNLTGGQTPLVISYVTGDLSFVAGWSNPTERADDCDDCIDGDDDGWVDAADPDCAKDASGTETNKTSVATCNDGLDNNDDGKIDSEDPLCKNGLDGESTCDDDEDNDGDGWVDGLDSECLTGDQEAGEDDVSATCSNGLDDDGDGWIDGEDPACSQGSDLEDDGFGTNQCNDGTDNDGHGDIDSDDPFCWNNGADATSETVATAKGQCIDTLDNDKDGFFDAFDPDCEVSAISGRELVQSWEVDADHPRVPQCYDGIDNDGDGRSDADDSGCWRADLGFQADGFWNAEDTDWGTECTDGLDGDGDGWIDAGDPDCAAGNAATQVEVGLGTGKCNNGIDEDSDGKIDAADPGCKDAFDTIEGS